VHAAADASAACHAEAVVGAPTPCHAQASVDALAPCHARTVVDAAAVTPLNRLPQPCDGAPAVSEKAADLQLLLEQANELVTAVIVPHIQRTLHWPLYRQLELLPPQLHPMICSAQLTIRPNTQPPDSGYLTAGVQACCDCRGANCLQPG
jgi:hypothetical protein